MSSDKEVINLGFGENVVRSSGHKMELLVLELDVHQTLVIMFGKLSSLSPFWDLSLII